MWSTPSLYIYIHLNHCFSQGILLKSDLLAFTNTTVWNSTTSFSYSTDPRKTLTFATTLLNTSASRDRSNYTMVTSLTQPFSDLDLGFTSSVGGNESIAGSSEIGDTHPTIVDQGGPVDWWAKSMRDYIWAPLGIGVALQWIILGMLVGVAMGSAGAQARSMFSQLVPETRTSEFFGFFGFLGKSAAMIGTFIYGITSSVFDSRVALMSVTVVILFGTYLANKIDLEEGIRVAAEEDARIRGESVVEE